MKKYICGLCQKRGIRFCSTRKALRKHLREEHYKKKELTNKSNIGKKGIEKQSWWNTEEWE